MTVRHYSPSQNFNWNTNLANYIPHTICNDPVQKVVNVVMEIHNFGCERKILFSALFQLLLISNIHNNNKTHTHFVCLILFFVPYSLFFLSFWFCHFRWRAMSKKQLIATPNPTQPTLILHTHISQSSAQRHCFLINAHGYLLWKRFVFTLDKIVVSSGNRKKTKSRRAMHDPQLCLCDRGYGCAFIKWLLHTKFNFLLVSYRVCLCVICFFLSAYTEGKSNIFFITLQSNVYLHMRQTSHITHTHTHIILCPILWHVLSECSLRIYPPICLNGLRFLLCEERIGWRERKNSTKNKMSVYLNTSSILLSAQCWASRKLRDKSKYMKKKKKNESTAMGCFETVANGDTSLESSVIKPPEHWATFYRVIIYA